MDVTVYMKADAQQGGATHEHKGVRVTVNDRYLRVAYMRSRIVINYPYTSIEKWETR